MARFFQYPFAMRNGRLNLFKILLVLMLFNPMAVSANICHEVFAQFGKNQQVKTSFAEARVLLEKLDTTLERDKADFNALHFSDAKFSELRELFNKMTQAEFNALWDFVKPEHIRKLLFFVQNGMVKNVTDTQKRRLELLVLFMESDKFDIFWGKGDSYDRLYTHYPEWRGSHSKNQVGSTIGGVDTYVLGQVEKALVDYIKGSKPNINVKYSGFWGKLLMFPYFKVKGLIVPYHNQVRSKLEHIDLMKDSLEEIYYAEINGLNQAERIAFQRQIEGLREAKKAVTNELETVYFGRPIGAGGLTMLPSNGVDIFYVAKNIKHNRLLKDTSSHEHAIEFENIVAETHKILNQSRARKDKEPLTEDQMHPVFLKIRNKQYEREARRTRAKWREILDQEVGESETLRVHYKYTVVETKTVGSGKNRRTVVKTRTVHTSTTHYLTYFEILIDRLERFNTGRSYANGTITRVSGKEEVLQRSQGMYKRQHVLYHLRDLTESFERLIEGHGEVVLRAERGDKEGLNQALELVKAKIETIKGAIFFIRENNLKLTDREIENLWLESSDNPLRFRQRNEALLLGFKMFKELYETYEVQLKNKTHDLYIKPDVLDHSQSLAKAKLRTTLWLTALTGTTTGAIGTPIYQYNTNPGFREAMQGLLQLLN